MADRERVPTPLLVIDEQYVDLYEGYNGAIDAKKQWRWFSGTITSRGGLVLFASGAENYCGFTLSTVRAKCCGCICTLHTIFQQIPISSLRLYQRVCLIGELCLFKDTAICIL